MLVTRSATAHVALCIGDLLLRFVWALSVFGGVPSRGLGMFFFECVEIVRRTVWAIFRIEWEVVSKLIYPAGTYESVGLHSLDPRDSENVDEEDEY